MTIGTEYPVDRNSSFLVESGAFVALDRFSVVEETGRTVVVLSGELDLANRDELRQCFAPLRGRVVADLTAVSFIDSSIIGVLIGVQNRLAVADGELRLRNPQDFPREALETVGLGKWIE